METLRKLLANPAARRVLVLVVASALAAGATALGLPSDIVQELCK
jgi:hypothetical protein